MKKILLIAVAVIFTGSFMVSAQYENACRFKDNNGTVWNGSTRTNTRTYQSGNEYNVNAQASGTYGSKTKNVSGSVSGGYTHTSGTVSSSTGSECCKPNSNDCSSYYKKGHSDIAKNADNQSW